jgi:CRP/FNR family transcriptional regulator, nitrogen oxide reductase regulator
LAQSAFDIGRLAKVPLFAGMTPGDLAVAARAAHTRVASAGEFFFRQGDRATTCYVLLRGRVRVTQSNPEGHQVILHMIAPGDGFALVAPFTDGEYGVAAEVVEDSEALTWDGPTMERLMQQSPQLAINALRFLSGRLHELQDRYRELATEKVERRIARTVLRLARQTGKKTEAGILIDLPLSRQDLAEMTGTTLFTVSRVLSSWESAGLVEIGRERVVIRRGHGLVRIAEDLPNPT